MNVLVQFANTVTEFDSLQIKKIANAIQKEGKATVKCITSQTEQGKKDSGLILGLTIAGMAISTFDVLITTLTYLESKQPRYSITVHLGNTDYSIDNIPEEKLLPFKEKLEKDITPEMKILIANK